MLSRGEPNCVLQSLEPSPAWLAAGRQVLFWLPHLSDLISSHSGVLHSPTLALLLSWSRLLRKEIHDEVEPPALWLSLGYVLVHLFYDIRPMAGPLPTLFCHMAENVQGHVHEARSCQTFFLSPCGNSQINNNVFHIELSLFFLKVSLQLTKAVFFFSPWAQQQGQSEIEDCP